MVDYISSYSGAEIDEAVGKGILLPSIVVGDALKWIRVNSDGNGFEAVDPVIPAGTRMLFYQAAAPTGWVTKSDFADNYSLILGNNYGSGGSDNPVSWQTDISVANHAAHTHAGPSHTHTYTDVIAHTHTAYCQSGDINYGPYGGSMPPGAGVTGSTGVSTGTTAASGTANTGNPSATLTHSVTQDTYTPVYAICVLGTKS